MWISAALMLCMAAMPALAGPRSSVVKAVYQIDGGDEQALRALRNIRNHLQADPTAHIVVVALGAGVDFLLKGENDAGGYPFELIVQDLTDQGVKFEVCNNTLDSRHLDKDKFIDKVTFIASGFAELARLQAKEGYAYLKP
jgi:intracellular sulfur oxidation DsrE/DsrF family protein